MVKAKDQSPNGLLQPLSISKLKWKEITMNFVMGFPRSR